MPKKRKPEITMRSSAADTDKIDARRHPSMPVDPVDKKTEKHSHANRSARRIASWTRSRLKAELHPCRASVGVATIKKHFTVQNGGNREVSFESDFDRFIRLEGRARQIRQALLAEFKDDALPKIGQPLPTRAYPFTFSWAHYRILMRIQTEAAEYLTFIAATGRTTVEAVYADENVWLTQKMLGMLYNVETHTVNYHLKKVFQDRELEEASVIRKFRITALIPRAAHRQTKRQSLSAQFKKHMPAMDMDALLISSDAPPPGLWSAGAGSRFQSARSKREPAPALHSSSPPATYLHVLSRRRRAAHLSINSANGSRPATSVRWHCSRLKAELQLCRIPCWSSAFRRLQDYGRARSADASYGTADGSTSRPYHFPHALSR